MGYGALSLWYSSAPLAARNKSSCMSRMLLAIWLVSAEKNGDGVLLGDVDVMFVSLDEGSA